MALAVVVEHDRPSDLTAALQAVAAGQEAVDLGGRTVDDGEHCLQLSLVRVLVVTTTITITTAP